MEDLRNYKSKDGTYLIPVEWAVYSTVQVKANNLLEAINFVKEHDLDIPLPTLYEYIDGSFKIYIECDEDAINAQSYHTIGDVFIDLTNRKENCDSPALSCDTCSYRDTCKSEEDFENGNI